MPNPYPARFSQLLDGVPPGSVCLDLGAGRRMRPGLVSMEYIDCAPWQDLRGDCLDLPFRDDCADLILSQAVLEHVTDPNRAVREMRRVLRPGGVLYVEIAFMQPLHMDPWHYFNVTPRGLTWLLRDWDVEEQGTLGTFEDMVEWVYREAGVPRGQSQRQQDRRARPPGAQYERVAYGVYARARKPV